MVDRQCGKGLLLLKRLQEVALWARIVSDEMRMNAGGDAYTFEGSMNSINGLRDALDNIDFGDTKDFKV